MKPSVILFFLVSLLILAGALGALYWYIIVPNRESASAAKVDTRTQEQKNKDMQVQVENNLKIIDESTKPATEADVQALEKALNSADKNTASSTATKKSTTTAPDLFANQPDAATAQKAADITSALKGL